MTIHSQTSYDHRTSALQIIVAVINNDLHLVACLLRNFDEAKGTTSTLLVSNMASNDVPRRQLDQPICSKCSSVLHREEAQHACPADGGRV